MGHSYTQSYIYSNPRFIHTRGLGPSCISLKFSFYRLLNNFIPRLEIKFFRYLTYIVYVLQLQILDTSGLDIRGFPTNTDTSIRHIFHVWQRIGTTKVNSGGPIEFWKSGQ